MKLALIIKDPEATLFISTAGFKDENINIGKIKMNIRNKANKNPEQHFSLPLRLYPS